MRLAKFLILSAAAAVLIATLLPSLPAGGGAPITCFLCGDRRWADATLNVILFIPLGAAIALTGAPLWLALLGGFGLSLLVEAAQFALIPGRDASLTDLLFNSLGAVCGLFLLRSARYWLRPGPTMAAGLSLLAAIAAATIVAVTGWMLKPDPPQRPYHILWTPELRHLDDYGGEVYDAVFAGAPLEPGFVRDPTEIRSAIANGASIDIRASPAPPTARVAALVAIYDSRQQEVLLVGAHAGDLVFRQRVRAASLGFDQPDLRLREALREAATGDTLRIEVQHSDGRACLAAAARRSCSVGFTPGSGWSILLYDEYWPLWVHALLDLAWVAALALPLGLWARARWTSGVALVVMTAALTLLPAGVGLMPAPLLQLGSAAAGVLVGVLLGRQSARVRDRGRHTTPPPGV